MNELFVKALKNRFKMKKEDAIELAKTVENIFNGKNEIEDMTIDKYTRSLFFELEREKLLKIRRDEFKEKGKCIRKFYWSFNNSIIKIAAFQRTKEEKYRIYQEIPKNAWVCKASVN
jgi:hypothetical protein